MTVQNVWLASRIFPYLELLFLLRQIRLELLRPMLVQVDQMVPPVREPTLHFASDSVFVFNIAFQTEKKTEQNAHFIPLKKKPELFFFLTFRKLFKFVWKSHLGQCAMQ